MMGNDPIGDRNPLFNLTWIHGHRLYRDEPVPHYPRPSMDGPYGMGGEAPREPVPQRPPTYGRPAPEQPYGMGDYDAQRPAQASNGYVHTPTSPSQRYPLNHHSSSTPTAASYQQQQSGAQVERSRSRSGSQGRSQRQAAPPQQGYDGYQQQQGQGHSRSGSGSSRPPTIPKERVWAVINFF
ncbi:hypothetical protein BC829DRAFT_287332 [Chytridium lagenaria]|nr:hypothetical protein BC829DRAFT_287332 [Chytridium lagenaria]